MRNKGGKQQGSSPYLLDRNLTPRIEQYALNNDITDIEDVVDYLRRSYKEYQRKQIAALRQMVVKAVQAVQQKGVAKPELQLQARENQHLARQASKAAADSSSEEDDSSDEGEDSDSSADKEAAAATIKPADGDLDPTAAADIAAATATTPAPATKSNTGLNSSLLNMYSAGKQAADAAAAAAGAQVGGGGTSSDSSGSEKSDSDDDSEPDPNAPPAFAPPHVIAAAAARALAAEKAAKAAAAARKAGTQLPPAKQQQQTPPAAAAAPPPPPSSSAAAESAGGSKADKSAADVADAAGVESASGGKAKKSRSAEEAGIGRDSRAVSKRARRVSAAPNAAAAAAAAGGGAGSGQGINRRGGGSAVTAPRPMRYADLGGVEEVLADIKELIEYPLKHPEVYAWLGVEPPRGVLLHGPPGCGKTALAHAIACECGVPFLRVSAPEVVSGMSGESEARLRQLFQEAQDVAPSIIFIDEIDAIAPKRESAQRQMEHRIVAQMLTCMDDLAVPPVSPVAAAEGDTTAAAAAAAAAGGADAAAAAQQPQQQQPRRGHVVVIGATNRPDSLDPALRRAGRFDREISLGIPTEAARQQILRVLTRNLRLQGGFDFGSIARKTPGFVGADLAALTKEAAAVAVSRIFTQLDRRRQQQQQELQQQQQQQQLALTAGAAVDAAVQQSAAAAAADSTPATLDEQQQQDATAVVAVAAAAAAVPRLGAGPLTPDELSDLAISMSDFEAALPKVQPSVRREGFTTKPDATWEDVGSLEEVREELSFSISQPIAHPEAFAAMGLSAASGVLLYGPPGCGKTLVAKAVAAESGANFISIKGPELLNKYVGESERAVRQLFARARAAHPCVLFFDEMDALAPRRGSDNNAPAERLVNQLLTEMDGIDGRVGVYVIAATNRPDMIDPALLRPGRLDKVLYVPLPPADGRASILAAAGRKTPMAPGVLEQAQALVRSDRCEGFSGADVAALVKEAAVLALKEAMAAAAAAAAKTPGTSVGDAPAAATAASTASAPQYPLVFLRHFEMALLTVTPSVNKRDRRAYEAMRTKLRGARAHISSAATAEAGGGVDQPQGSGMVDGDVATAGAAAGKAGGDDMEGTDDVPEAEDPMKD